MRAKWANDVDYYFITLGAFKAAGHSRAYLYIPLLGQQLAFGQFLQIWYKDKSSVSRGYHQRPSWGPAGAGCPKRCLSEVQPCPSADLSSSDCRTWLPAADKLKALLSAFLTSSRVLQVRQTMNIGSDKSFAATPNARNEAMTAEAGDFANHLKRCEKDIRTLRNATESECSLLPNIKTCCALVTYKTRSEPLL